MTPPNCRAHPLASPDCWRHLTESPAETVLNSGAQPVAFQPTSGLSACRPITEHSLRPGPTPKPSPHSLIRKQGLRHHPPGALRSQPTELSNQSPTSGSALPGNTASDPPLNRGNCRAQLVANTTTAHSHGPAGTRSQPSATSSPTAKHM